jgi:hypothetical protein
MIPASSWWSSQGNCGRCQRRQKSAQRTEQRRRVDKVDDDKFDVPVHMFGVGDYIPRSIPGDTAERHQREKLLPTPTKVPMQVVMAFSPSTYICCRDCKSI